MAKSPKKKVPDQNLALIAIILGATSFGMGIFTGIPAIIVGLVALRRKAGSSLHAKLAILFGVLSTILWALIVWLVGFHFFNAPLAQQFSVPREDYKEITKTINSLNDYKKDRSNFPLCQESETPESCIDWRQFTDKYPDTVKKPVVFIDDVTAVPDQPSGTVVYVQKATCFFNTPTLPSYLRDKSDPGSGPPDDNVALIYFHAKGRACYSTDQRYSD